MATVYGWESLIVGKKNLHLSCLDVLDPSLCEIKMSKLNKQHISETGYYEVNILMKFV